MALFVHGVLLNGHLWRHQLGELSDIRRTIAVDLLAHGDTEITVDQDVSVTAMLPVRCNDRPARSTITFFATGMSCGGVIVLSRLGAGYEIRVNWLTGGIEVAPRGTL